ncbi:hypothetical protein WJX81_005788 [Elliptochloris bilobata]|uniref:Uncharacterized protein n=1 Tax=Elliptochloris bilobata TaxID=381761 RepID=A0AAW1R228_9CHLO
MEGDAGPCAALGEAEKRVKQLEREKKELEAQAEKLRYRVDILVATVREGDALLKAALSGDDLERTQLADKLAHLCS